MTLSELSAFEAAYEVLEPLDAASRRRALQWLTDALAQSRSLKQATVATPAKTEPARARRRSAAATVTSTSAPSSARPARRGRAAKAEKTGSDGRVYRRMPAANEVMAAYGQVGTISGLAEHYSVPTHTVNSWARRLRQQGYPIGRNA